jgi:hypothetical protein
MEADIDSETGADSVIFGDGSNADDLSVAEAELASIKSVAPRKSSTAPKKQRR